MQRRWWLGLGCIGAVLLGPPVLLEVQARLGPLPPELRSKADAAPVRLTDRRGGLLREAMLEGRPAHGQWVPLEQVPEPLVQALLAGEDHRFFEHGGVDWLAVGRALVQNVASGRVRSGASTLTMQLVRLRRFPAGTRTLPAKWRQAVLARRLELHAGKRTLLEHYLNRAPFGRGIVGVAAAAERFFGKPVQALTSGEATLLAVLPRAPSRYDPRFGLQAALARRRHVLRRMVVLGWLDEQRREDIERQPIVLRRAKPPAAAWHFGEAALKRLPEALLREAAEVRTTLDPGLQREVEQLVARHLRDFADTGLHQAAVVVLDPRSGAVRAWVGSGGERSPAGWVDMVQRRRPPGSALKPFFYALAMEEGDSPATVVLDEADAPGLPPWPGRPPPEHGPSSYREALAGSYNIAAMLVVRRVALHRAAVFLREQGITELPQPDEAYGLWLALGAGWSRLLDVTAAFSAFVQGGRAPWPRLVAWVRRLDGRRWTPPEKPARRMFSAASAWLVMDILADPEARYRVFGRDNPFDLPFRVAVKTGTAGGLTDTWVLAATEQAVAGVWAGRTDGRPTHGYFAMDLAGPLAEDVLWTLRRRGPFTLPPPPGNLRRVAVCPRSGLHPTEACPTRRSEWFRRGTEPQATCDVHGRDARNAPSTRDPAPSD